ncbi:hypothetical protein TWF679_004353 [Orbilia oligospora]|uniref:Pheromone-regulated membrane protein 6 n=1 Tax=Orbilia oligospora TaxID=2813651 RepID=A0A8H8VMP2_ORBOL|nr:hypothetical protein TWF679_004353 [Orbilia oligospora]
MGLLRRNRDEVPVNKKQKWDYINLNDFKTRSCWSPVAYFFFFVNAFFGVAVVAADCYTAVNLLVFDRWSSKIDPVIPFRISKWIFAGCIIFSFVLIGVSILWAVKAIKGNSIARGYLNVYAQRWYCVGRGGYKRFLVFTELTKSKHGSDYVMLFTYFTFKGWAKVLLADGPRQILNGVTLYAVMKAKIIPGTTKSGFSGLLASIKALEEESLTQAIILSVMLFTCVWWILTFLSLAFAVLLWIMFIWHHVPSGHTLGSYCREKVDKRLLGIVAKNHKRTIEEEREERMKADQAGLGARKPTLPNFGDAPTGPAKPPVGPTLPSISEKPVALGLKRTNTMETFTTTVSSRPDTNMPSRPPYAAARPQFPMRSSTNDTAMSTTSSMFDESASLIGDRKDPFARTNTPLYRPQPPVGPYGRNYGPGHGPNSSQASLTNPYETAPLQPHDFLGSQQYLPPVNRNDTVSPFYQHPPPVNRNDTISPLGNGPSPVQHRPLNFEPTQAPFQPFPPNGSIPRRFPVRAQEQNFDSGIQQPPIAHTPSPAPEFSKYTEHRHTPPIHHMPQSEIFEMDGGVTTQSNTKATDAIELSSSPPRTTPAPIQSATGSSFSAHPMAFELDTGVPVVAQDITKSSPSPQTRTRRLTPPQPITTTAPQTKSPPKPGPQGRVGLAYNKPTYQPAGAPIASTSTPPSQAQAQRQLPQRRIQQDFEREEHGVGRNIHGNYDIEADVLDSYLHRSPQSQMQPQPPQPLQRPFMQYESQGQQGSRPSTPTRGLPVRRESGDSYYSNSGALGPAFGPPMRSMTNTPSAGFVGSRSMRGDDGFGMPERSMTAPFARQPDVRNSPPRGNSRIFENRMAPSPPRGRGPQPYGRNNGNGSGNGQGGYGGNNSYEQGGYGGGGYSAW